MAVFRRPVRSRPIRLYLISMFAVALISLVALWAFAASVTVPAAINDHKYNTSTAALDSPAFAAVTYELPVERAQTYAWLLGNRTGAKTPLLTTRATVDKALPGAVVSLEAVSDRLSAANKGLLQAVVADLHGLGSLRQSVDAGKLSPIAAFQAY